jgi:hypothetical protein
MNFKREHLNVQLEIDNVMLFQGSTEDKQVEKLI